MIAHPDHCRIHPFPLQLQSLPFFWLFQNTVLSEKWTLLIFSLSRLIFPALLFENPVMFGFCLRVCILRGYKGRDSSQGFVFERTFLWLWWSTGNWSWLQTSKHKAGESPQHTADVCGSRHWSERRRTHGAPRFLPSCITHNSPHWHNTDWRAKHKALWQQKHAVIEKNKMERERNIWNINNLFLFIALVGLEITTMLHLWPFQKYICSKGNGDHVLQAPQSTYSHHNSHFIVNACFKCVAMR